MSERTVRVRVAVAVCEHGIYSVSRLKHEALESHGESCKNVKLFWLDAELPKPTQVSEAGSAVEAIVSEASP